MHEPAALDFDFREAASQFVDGDRLSPGDDATSQQPLWQLAMVNQQEYASNKEIGDDTLKLPTVQVKKGLSDDILLARVCRRLNVMGVQAHVPEDASSVHHGGLHRLSFVGGSQPDVIHMAVSLEHRQLTGLTPSYMDGGGVWWHFALMPVTALTEEQIEDYDLSPLHPWNDLPKISEVDQDEMLKLRYQARGNCAVESTAVSGGETLESGAPQTPPKAVSAVTKMKVKDWTEQLETRIEMRPEIVFTGRVDRDDQHFVKTVEQYFDIVPDLATDIDLENVFMMLISDDDSGEGDGGDRGLH